MELFKLFGTIALNGADKVKSDIDDTTGRAESGSSKMQAAFKKVGTAVVTYFAVDKIIEFGKSIVSASAEVSAEASAFEQIMGDYSNTAIEKLGAVADATGMLDTRLKPYMTSMTAKFKGLGYDIDDATTLATDGLTLAADAAAFWDKSLDESMSGLNSFINGSYEGGEAIGLFANDTQLAMYAVENGVVSATKEWANLDEATKQATRLQYAQDMYELSGATGQASKEADQYANVQANLNEKWRQFQAQIGTPLLQNIVLPAMTALSGLVDVLSSGFSTLQGWVGQVSERFGGLSTVTTALNTVWQTYGVPIFTTMQTLAQTVADSWSIIWPALQNMISSCWTNIQIIWTSILKPVFDTLMIMLNQLLSTFNYVWPTIANIVSNVFNLISQFWSTVLQPVLQHIGAFLQGVLLPAFQQVFSAIMDAVKVAFDFINDLWNNVLQPVLQGIIDFLSGVFTANWEKVWSGIQSIVTGVWNAISSVISGVLNAISSTVSSVINSISSTISSVFTGIKNTVTTIWNGIKDAIMTPINAAKDAVKGAIDAMKGFFNFDWKLPSIKLPHFKVTGSANPIDWLSQGIPKFSVEWYAKGGILDDPTLFGVNPLTGNAMGAGEAGPEAVTPIDVLLDYVRTAVREENSNVAYYIQRLIDMLADYFPQILDNLDRPIVLDDGTLVAKTAKKMDDQLGAISRGRRRGQ